MGRKILEIYSIAGFGGMLALLVGALPAQATYLGECAAALKTDTVEFQSNYAAQLSYLETIDETNYSKAQANGSINVIIEDLPVGASYSQFKEARNTFARKIGLQFNQEQSEGFLSYTLSKTGADAFSVCAKAALAQSGAHLEIQSMTKDTAAITVHWVPPPGYQGAAHLSVTASGGTVSGNVPVNWDTGGTAAAVISRIPNHDLFITINATTVKGSPLSSDTLLVPAYVNWVKRTTTTTRDSSQRSSGYCGGNGDGSNKAGNIVQVLSANDNEDLDSGAAIWADIKAGSEIPPPKDRYKFVEQNSHRVAGYMICSPLSADATSSISAVLEVPVKTTIYGPGP